MTNQNDTEIEQYCEQLVSNDAPVKIQITAIIIPNIAKLLLLVHQQ